ncbi:Kinesin protein, partial [Globisporangium splendens]
MKQPRRRMDATSIAVGEGESDEDSETTSASARQYEENGTEGKLKVVVRVRPLQKNEEPWSSTKGGEDEADDRLHNGEGVRGAPSTTTTSSLSIQVLVLWEKNGLLKILTADAVFPGESPQDRVFQSVQGIMLKIASTDSLQATIAACLPTMSGLEREDDDDEEEGQRDPNRAEYGVVPRSVDKLFTQIEREQAAANGAVSFGIYCSFIEIYNEKIYDILSNPVIGSGASQSSSSSSATWKNAKGKEISNYATALVTHHAGWNSTAKTAKDAPSLSIRQKLDGSVFVDGLTSRNLTTKKVMLQAFREVRTGTKIGPCRGHSIFQITLRKNILSGGSYEGDGGDSSPSKRSSAKGPQSRLSRLFFVDLAGSEKWHGAGRTAFIITISPSRASLEESFATLRFAERLKTLRCRPIRKQVFSSDLVGEQRLYYEQQIQTMRIEVNRLRELLKKAHRKSSEADAERTASAASSALVEENRRLKELLMQSERTRLMERYWRTCACNLNDGVMRKRRADSRLSTGTPPPLTEDEDDSDGNNLDGSMQQIDSLLSMLHSKEARLNWMLEAEMEAQNTQADMSKTPVAADSAPTNATPRSTITRTWAVERRLRNLVAVPPPLRSAAAPTISLAPSPAGNLDGTRQDSTTMVATASDRQKRHVNGGDALSALTLEKAKHDSPRQATRPAELLTTPPGTTGKQPPATGNLNSSSNGLAVATSEKHTNMATDRDSLPLKRNGTLSISKMQPVQPLKSASILKLVGNSGNKSGNAKSKDELVEEYKRARRAELEAMLRTMVQR